MNTQAVDTITGVVTISIFGITATLTPEDARNWGEVLTTYAPLILIGFLIWRLRLMDRNLASCETRHDALEVQHRDLNNKLLLAYAAIHRKGTTDLPSLKDFDSGDFNIKDHVESS